MVASLETFTTKMTTTHHLGGGAQGGFFSYTLVLALDVAGTKQQPAPKFKTL